MPARLRADLERLRATLDLRVGDVLLARGMVAWANLMGAISLELFGHLHNVVDTPGALFDMVVEEQAVRLFEGTGSPRPTSKRT